MKNFILKYQGYLLALAIAIFAPAAFIQAESMSTPSSSGTTINCQVAGACSILVQNGQVDSLAPSAPAKPVKFGSGVESSSFGGTVSSTGFISNVGVVTSTAFSGSGGTTTTLSENAGTSLQLLRTATTNTLYTIDGSFCMPMKSASGTVIYLFVANGAPSGLGAQLATSTVGCSS